MGLTDMMRRIFYRIPPVQRMRREITKLHATNAMLQRAVACEGDTKMPPDGNTSEVLVAALSAKTEEYLQLLGQYGDPPWVPNGHFYSPIHSVEEVRRDYARVYCSPPSQLPDINLREQEQLELLPKLLPYFEEFPFEAKPLTGRRYGYDNGAYTFGDSVFLYAMLRHVRPNRLIEIGSGHSSCLTLDTNDMHFDRAIDCTFIEPYPQLLYSLLKESEKEQVKVIPKRLQDVNLNVFVALKENDVLFIDSTHVSKIGSDVNRLFFEVLPILAEGVYIHIHDIFYPFEYPETWVLGDRRAWNEQYVLRALLQSSTAYEIVLFNTFMTHFHPQFFEKHLPKALKDRGGSIWLRKTRSPKF